MPSIKELNRKEKYLVIDPMDGNYEQCETIEEARKFIYDQIHDFKVDGEGIPLDVEGFAIYELKERLYLDVVAERQNYADEQWEEMGYSDQHDTIVNPEIKEV